MIGWLAEQCGQHLLAEKWLLAPQLRIAGQWKDRLNLGGCHTINLHAKTLATIAVSLVSDSLAKRQLHFASQPTAEMVLRSVLVHLLAESKLGYFAQIQSIDGLSNSVSRSVRDLRLANVPPSEIDDKIFESSAKGPDFRLIYQAYVQKLEQQSMVDYAGCIQMAIAGIEDGSIKLPSDLLILMPERSPLSHAEQCLLETLAANCMLLDADPFDSNSPAELLADRINSSDVKFQYLAGVGEVNEIRGVFQRILWQQDGGPKRLDDTEILHTDYRQYVPLVLEQLTGWLAGQQQDNTTSPDLDSLPVTFAEGIACIYSRPGRALRGWLRWTQHEFVQTRAVQLIREGLLMRPESAESIGYSRLASALRKIPIGFQSERYLPKIRESIQAAEQSLREYQENGDRDEGEAAGEIPRRDFGLSSLRAVAAMVGPLVDLAPAATDDAGSVLRKAQRFLLQSARADNKLDRYARQKLLDDIAGMQATLQLSPDAELDVLQWLQQLPMESRVLASGPRPGCVHVAPLSQGGHSGRSQVFVVGLDDGRYPKRINVDPVLLDAERQRLSTSLRTSIQVAEEIQQSLDRALYRVLSSSPLPRCAVEVTISYSVRNLVDDRANFPSASMLELFRISEQNDDSHLEDVLAHVGPPVAFVSREADDHLAVTDAQLSMLLAESDADQRQQWLDQHFTHSRFAGAASQSHSAAQLTEYDGLVPAAGTDLDPAAAETVSPSRLETYGVCPRRFFFSRGLGVYPPDEWVVDWERWLDPLQFGNFVHALFERFLRELTQRDLTPSLDRDLDPLRELLHAGIDELKSEIPIPNQDAYHRTRDLLEETCEIFLAKEQEYCRTHDARPWVLEAAIGLDEQPRTELDCREPIPLALSDGRVIRVGGRLDRVDKLMSRGSERYAIWDYKSGSSYGFDQENPFQQGRKLQPFLYVGLLRHRIAGIGGNPDAVESFGYFFPSPKTDGLRLHWTRGELRSGDQVLRNVCDLIASGVFLPTTNANDCTFCDYLSVCGDAQVVATRSLWKSSQACNKMLDPWRSLREIEPAEEAS